MQLDTRETIHTGLQYVVNPLPAVNADLRLKMQQALDSVGLTYDRVNLDQRQLVIGRNAPPLEIRVGWAQRPPLGQLVVIRPSAGHALETFIEETEQAIAAFLETSSAPNQQIVSRIATLRDLYQTGGLHGFQDIWEGVLAQQQQSLEGLGRPVQGGGLRFVMPPVGGEEDPMQIDLRVESWLREHTRIFVEGRFQWRTPLPPSSDFAPAMLLRQADEYMRTAIAGLWAQGD